MDESAGASDRARAEADADPALLAAIQREAEECMLKIGFKERRLRKRTSVSSLQAPPGQEGQQERAAEEEEQGQPRLLEEAAGEEGGDEALLLGRSLERASKRRRVE